MYEVVFCVFVRSVTRNLINSIQSSTTHRLPEWFRIQRDAHRNELCL